MPMDIALKNAFLTQTMNVAVRTGMDASGDYTYGAPSPIPCRVENVRRIVRPQPGEELVTTHLIFAESAITVEDALWLPDEIPATDPSRRAAMVDIILNEHSQIDHYEVHV